MSRLQQIERRIDRALRGLLRSSSPERRGELIEVHRAILEEVASRVDSLPRGRLTFGYSSVNVQVLIEPDRRRSYEMVFVEGAALERDIKSYFDDRPVEYPAGLKVNVELVEDIGPEVRARGFDVAYSNLVGDPAAPGPGEIRLTLLVGDAEKSEYRFRKQRVNIGRLSEVLDGQLRPIRRNDVAFKDEATSLMVSRTHAHIEFDSESSCFRLFDDGSAHGTAVLRGGSLLQVPNGPSKGVSLLRDDEIILGRVHIRFELIDALNGVADVS